MLMLLIKDSMFIVDATTIILSNVFKKYLLKLQLSQPSISCKFVKKDSL